MTKKYCADCGAHVMATFLKCPQCGSQNWSSNPVVINRPAPNNQPNYQYGQSQQTGGYSTYAASPQSRGGFIGAISSAASKTFSPSGRASRSEYWYMVLFNILVIIGLVILASFLGYRYDLSAATWLVMAALVIFYIWAAICMIMLSVRRLHDMNLSGWWALPLYFAPSLVGALQGVYPDAAVFLSILQLMIWLGTTILFCQRGTIGSNRFGPEPAYFV